MRNYVAPSVTPIEGLAEGVYMASGDKACYTVQAWIHQTPEVGRKDYRIRMLADHAADHTSSHQRLTIGFNQPVKFVSYDAMNASLTSGDGTAVLVIDLGYWNNPTDKIGTGDLIVEANDGLAITSASLSCVQ